MNIVIHLVMLQIISRGFQGIYAVYKNIKIYHEPQGDNIYNSIGLFQV